MFIWHGGVVSGGVVSLDLVVGRIDDGIFCRSIRCGESLLAAATVALDLVYLLATEIFQRSSLVGGFYVSGNIELDLERGLVVV